MSRNGSWRRRIPIGMLLLLGMGCGDPKEGGADGGGKAPVAVLVVDDQTPAESPCPQEEDGVDVSQVEYDSLRAIIAEILADGTGIIADIDAQIRANVPDEKERTVTVSVSVCDREEFRQKFIEDRAGSDATEEDRAQLGAQANAFFDAKGGFAYTTNQDRVTRVKIFCKRGLAHSPTRTADVQRLRELVVHELVHAKLFAMQWLGISTASLPFQNHGEPPMPEGADRPFYDEIKRLLEKITRRFPLPVVCEELVTVTCEPPCPGGACCADQPTPRGFIPCSTICDPEQPWCQRED